MEHQNEQLKTLRGVWPEVIEDDDMELYNDENLSKIYNFHGFKGIMLPKRIVKIIKLCKELHK